ncbi:MAG: hypothetical protein HYT80_04975 [Euryarchaeota archaeon]|nr:hypothetical protein [Euryarchaeota archaeon]
MAKQMRGDPTLIMDSVGRMFTSQILTESGPPPEAPRGQMTFNDPTHCITLADRPGHYADAQLTLGVLDIRDVLSSEGAVARAAPEEGLLGDLPDGDWFLDSRLDASLGPSDVPVSRFAPAA